MRLSINNGHILIKDQEFIMVESLTNLLKLGYSEKQVISSVDTSIKQAMFEELSDEERKWLSEVLKNEMAKKK